MRPRRPQLCFFLQTGTHCARGYEEEEEEEEEEACTVYSMIERGERQRRKELGG